MQPRSGALGAILPACAPLPALVIGILAMRQINVGPRAWMINIIATILGLLIWAFGRRLRPPTRRASLACLTAVTIAALLLPFTSEGVVGVYRWVTVAGLRLHASAVVTPVVILCVAAAMSRGISGALAIGATGATIVALQPDAAQTISLASGCAVVVASGRTTPTRNLLLSLALLCAVSVLSFVRRDPLPPVAHVEQIFGIVASKGPVPAAGATIALLVLRRRSSLHGIGTDRP